MLLTHQIQIDDVAELNCIIDTEEDKQPLDYK